MFERNFGRIGFDHYVSILGVPDATPLMPDEPWTYRGLEFGGTEFPTTTEILNLVGAFDNVWLVLSMQTVDRSDSITTAFESVYGAPQMYSSMASTYSSTLASMEPMIHRGPPYGYPGEREIRKSKSAELYRNGPRRRSKMPPERRLKPNMRAATH